MARLGIHLPNRYLEAGELSEILSLGCPQYLVYVVNPADDPELRYWAEVIREIKRQRPGASVHARLERRGGFDPAGDAVLLRRAIAVLGADTYRIRNEPNQEGGGTAQEWRHYLVALAQALGPDALALVSVPALSPGLPNYPEWLQASADGMVEAGFSRWDCHAYGNASEVEAVVAAHAERRQGRDIIVTEYNFGAGRPYSLDQWASEIPAVLEVCRRHGIDGPIVFIWMWRHPDMVLPTPVDVRGTVVAEQIRRIATMPQWKLAFEPYATAHPEVGTPEEDIAYDDHGNAWQHGTGGLLFSHKADNWKIHWFPRPKA